MVSIKDLGDRVQKIEEKKVSKKLVCSITLTTSAKEFCKLFHSPRVKSNKDTACLFGINSECPSETGNLSNIAKKYSFS